MSFTKKIAATFVVLSLAAILIILYAGVVPGCGRVNNGNPLVREGRLTIYNSRILVGTDATYPPFEFIEDGIPKGFDMDIAAEIALRLDKEMEVVPITWDFTYKIPEDIRLDMIISAVSADAEKEEIVDFSDPYYTMEYLLITLADAELVIKEDLKGSKVGMIDSRVKDLDIEDLQDFTIEEYKDILIMMEDLRSGNIDAVIVSVPVGKNIIEENSGFYRILEVIKSLRTFSMVFHEGSPLKDKVNRILEEMVQDGTYQQIYDRWFAFDGM